MRPGKKFIKGETTEEKFNSIERVLFHMASRSNQVVAGVVTPFPVSHFVPKPERGGVVLRYIFLCEGSITKAGIFIEEFVKDKKVTVKIDVYSESGSRGSTFLLEQQALLMNTEMSINAGDRLVVRVISDEDYILQGIWIGILWVPVLNDAEVKQFLISELEAVGESYAEEIREETEGQSKKEVSRR